MVQHEFSDYSTNCITEAMLADPKQDRFKAIHTKTNTC